MAAAADGEPVIRELSELTLAGGVELLYAAIAGAVAWGAVLGVLAIWISTAARGGRG